MKRLIALILAAACLLAMSCATQAAQPEEALPADEAGVLLAEGEEAVAGMFSIEGLDIAGYRLRGEGPDGASFGWIDVTSPKVALADIRRGMWTLYAQALNADGEVMAAGKLETFLSEDSPVDNLVLDRTEGEGDLSCLITWSAGQVRHPKVEIYVKPADGGDYKAVGQDGIEMGEDGSCRWAAKLSPGSYIARIVLDDGSRAVAGAAAAVRIIDGMTSVGDVGLVIGSLSTVYGITIQNTPAGTIAGNLAFAEGVVTFATPDPLVNAYCDWYVDGEPAGSRTASIDLPSLGLEKGYHRIDCIVRTEDQASINSCSLMIHVEGESIATITENAVNAMLSQAAPLQ